MSIKAKDRDQEMLAMKRLRIGSALAVFLIALVTPLAGAAARTVAHRQPDRASANALPAANYLVALGTATVDGVKTVGEWDAAATVDFAVNEPPGSPGPPMPATLFVMNDASNLYAAFLVTRSSLGASSVDIEFDNDADGTLYANGDDVLLINPSLGGVYDEYRSDQPPCPSGAICGFLDADNGGTNDGLGATTNNGTYSFYEMSHPLNSNDDNHDFSLAAGDLVGATISVRFCDTAGCADTYLPGQRLIAVAPLPNGKANQRIFFSALPPMQYGDAAFRITAKASSRLPVSLTASGQCVVNDSLVVITGAGDCTISASQAGDDYYNPASEVVRSFAIERAEQEIDFPAISKKALGTPDFRPSASASSGLRLQFTARGHCTMRQGKVHLTGVGSCTLTALQPGDPNWVPAASEQTFRIDPPRCRVPKLVGRQLGAARQAIGRNHCSTGKIARAFSVKKTGIVIAQSRRAGRVLPFKSKINLVVSRGRRR